MDFFSAHSESHTAFVTALCGVYILLSIATIVSIYLAKTKPHNETFSKVKTIVRSWWLIIVPPTIALILGPLAVLILFFVISCFGIREITKNSPLFTNHRPVLFVLQACTVLQYLAIYLGWTTLFYALVPLMLIWVFPVVILLKPDIENFPRLLALVFGSLLVSYYLSHIPALMSLEHSLWTSTDQARLAILILMFTTELNDILQFLSGKAFGKKKIVPILSPNKTEAGFIGGVLGSMLLFSYLGPSFLQLTIPQSLIMGATISITGIFGDLVFSAVKRNFKLKDFSQLIPGHGGLLDRLDSLILTAPMFFHLMRLFRGGSL